MRSSGGAKNAKTAPRTHVSASEDPEYGPRNEFPAEFETLALDEYVVEVDGEDWGDSRSDVAASTLSRRSTASVTALPAQYR